MNSPEIVKIVDFVTISSKGMPLAEDPRNFNRFANRRIGEIRDEQWAEDWWMNGWMIGWLVRKSCWFHNFASNFIPLLRGYGGQEGRRDREMKQSSPLKRGAGAAREGVCNWEPGTIFNWKPNTTYVFYQENASRTERARGFAPKTPLHFLSWHKKRSKKPTWPESRLLKIL